MNKQFHPQSSSGGSQPKEKKIVNEQEQNKPVNTGDQPFEEEDPTIKENEKTEKKEGNAQTSANEILNKDDDDILNKDPGVQPE